MTELALDIRDLVLEFSGGTVRALDGIDLQVPAGSILGIVGESGSGKSTLGFAAGRLMPEGVVPSEGQLNLMGEDVWSLGIDRMREIRQHELRYIFQDPIATLDPTKKIEWQLQNAIPEEVTREQVIKVLEDVGLPDPEQVANAWPHELSGGMAQRVVIAMALLGNPKVIIADEATSALDASVRIRVLELLRDLSQNRGITLLIISHDLWAVRRFCDDIAIMYGGRVVEHGPAKEVFKKPAHPYTQALLGATAGHEKPGEKLSTIPGIPPLLFDAAEGCAFAPRCTHAQKDCTHKRPEREKVKKDWTLLCHHWRKVKS